MRTFVDAIKAAGSILRGERDSFEDSVYSYMTEDSGFNADWSGARAEGFHPSGMFYSCPRQELLARRIPKTEGPKWGRDMLLTFNHGHAIHFWFQNRILGPMGYLHGKWLCLRCDKVVEGTMPRSCACGASMKQMEFVERTLARGPFVGHIDGELELPSGRAILEIKSTSYSGSALQAPLDYNVYQANIYMWMTEIPQTLLVYVSKTKSFQIKTFLVSFDMPMLEDAMRRARDSIVVREMSDGEVASADLDCVVRACNSIADKPAKQCAWINECFGAKPRRLEV